MSRALLAEDPSERVLVVLQLSGGNDALNMLVPCRQDAYFRARPTLALPPRELHPITDDFALHPEMRGLGELFEAGHATAIHSVGYPAPDRSHFRSMEIWHTADPEHPPGESGWLGRLADQIGRRSAGAMAALHVGSGTLPLAFRALHNFTPSIADADEFQLRAFEHGFADARDSLLDTGGGTADLAFLREAARTTYAAARRMSELSRSPTSVDYPDTGLARRLRLVARLVTGGFGTRVFHVELDGFDTHSNQARAHGALLGELSGALRAFQRDLEQHGTAGQVLTLVFSEFGRRVQENGSRGTDHGAAAPVLLVGPGARGGLLGTAPDLERLVEGDVPFEVDLREVYAGLERDWMGLEPSSGIRPLSLLG